MAAVAGLAAGCGALRALGGGDEAVPPPGPPVVAAEPIDLAALRPEVDVDSLAAALVARADTLPPERLPALEAEIRDWLARLEYEDPTLLPLGRDPGPYFRARRGRLLDALGRSAFRRGDLREAEAALVSAVAQIHSRGTTDGFARQYRDLGDVLAARGRRDAAIEAYLDAELRGMGAAATPDLEAAWRRRHGSLVGLDRAREAERGRIADERRQALVADPLDRPLPAFRWPRRTGPPVSAAELVGRPLVVAVWDGRPPGWADRLEPLAAAVRRRGGALVGVWLGDDPAAAGPPRSWPVLLPPDPARARRLLGVGAAPALLVVDAAGRIRYRHGGAAATPPPIDDIVFQVEHLERRRTGSAAPSPSREVR